MIKLRPLSAFVIHYPKLLLLVKAPNYDENHGKCFVESCTFKDCFQEAFKVIPCHWFDFIDTGVSSNTQHVITFPIKDNQIEDFCCNYKTITVQSINNTMTVTGFPQGNKVRIAIDGEERGVKTKKEFNPFDTEKLRAAKVSGSGCIIISQ